MLNIWGQVLDKVYTCTNSQCSCKTPNCLNISMPLTELYLSLDNGLASSLICRQADQKKTTSYAYSQLSAMSRASCHRTSFGLYLIA